MPENQTKPNQTKIFFSVMVDRISHQAQSGAKLLSKYLLLWRYLATNSNLLFKMIKILKTCLMTNIKNINS